MRGGGGSGGVFICDDKRGRNVKVHLNKMAELFDKRTHTPYRIRPKSSYREPPRMRVAECWDSVGVMSRGFFSPCFVRISPSGKYVCIYSNKWHFFMAVFISISWCDTRCEHTLCALFINAIWISYRRTLWAASAKYGMDFGWYIFEWLSRFE